jgi:hypothetical protein
VDELVLWTVHDDPDLFFQPPEDVALRLRRRALRRLGDWVFWTMMLAAVCVASWMWLPQLLNSAAPAAQPGRDPSQASVRTTIVYAPAPVDRWSLTVDDAAG